MLVVGGMGDRNSYLVQQARPPEHQQLCFRRFDDQFRLQPRREPGHPLGLRHIDVVTAHELRDRHLAHVMVLHPPEQVVEHALAQRPLRHIERVDAELGEYRRHDRQPPGEDGRTIVAQPR